MPNLSARTQKTTNRTANRTTNRTTQKSKTTAENQALEGTMTESTTAYNVEPNQQTIQPKAGRISGDTYTARQIADYLGIHEDTVRKRYYERYCLEIFQNFPEKLRQGQLYTQLFFDECFRIRQSCDGDRIVMNNKVIVRHAPVEPGKLGLPITEVNPQVLSKKAYIKMRLEEEPELKPVIREDSPELIEAELILETTELAIYNPEQKNKLAIALDKAEDLGDGISGFLLKVNQSADVLADKASAQFAERFVDRFNKNMGELQRKVQDSLEQ